MHESASSLTPALQACEKGIVLQLADGTIQACNPTVQKILGLTLEQLQGWHSIDPPWQVIHIDGSLFAAENYPPKVTLQTGQPCTDVVMGLYKPSGELVWLLINTEPLFTADSTVPYAVITTFADITQQHLDQAELPLADSKQDGDTLQDGDRAATLEKISEEAFFFEQSLDLFSVIGLDGYFKRVNPAFTTTLGYTEAELLASPFIEFVHPDDHPVTLAEMAQLNTGAPTLGFENRYRTKDGSYRWLEWTASPQVEQGLIYCVARDITRQKQAEAALQQAHQELEQRVLERTAELERANAALSEREALYRALTQNIPNGAFHLFDHDLRYLLMEGSELKRLGFEGAELVGKTIWEVLPPETCAQIEPMYRAALRGQASVQEVPYQEQVYEVHTLPVRTEQGEIFAGMVLTQNMTHRKQAEAKLRESQAILQRQLNEIETIYQSAPIGLNVLDADLRFVRINERLAEMNGFPVEAHIGRTVRELLPEIADTAEQILRPILETGEPVLNVEITGETPAQPGVQRVWLESFLPLKDSDAGDGQGQRVIGISSVCQEITERKRAEERIHQFNLLINLSYEPIFVWDLEQGIISWNQGCEQLYGYTQEEAIGQISHTLLQTVYPLPQAEAAIILERDRQWTGELQHTTRTGKQVIVESRHQLIETNGRRLVLETNRDITERKQAEEALRRSEERYRTLFESMEDGFCVIEMLFDDHDQPVDYRFLEINPAFEQQTNLVQAVGKTARQLLPDLEAKWFELYGKVALTGEPVRTESASESMNRWFEVYAFRAGEPEQRRVAVLFKNVSDRKRSEIALQENEDRLRMAIASAQLGTWDWNLITGELKWDAGCKAMFGLPPDAESNIDLFFEGLHPDERDRLQEIIQTALDPASDGSYDTEFRTIGIQDNVERWVKAQGQAYYDANKKPLRFIGTVLNITEQKQVAVHREQLLKQEQAAREAAEDANRMKDEFLAILSHELRTPLNPILGWSKLLQSPKVSVEKLQQGLTTIERNAKQQVQLIDDLLDISRIIRGKLALNLETVVLSEPITAALETVRLAAEAKAIRLEMSLDLSVGQVQGDVSRLQQVIWNLLSNAIKFTPPGGRVTVRLAQIACHAQIVVSDTGRGIKPEFLPYVFELFRQQDSSTTRSFGGLGLGLAIVRQVVEAHGGTITAMSNGEGQGTTFTVQLPLLASQAHAAKYFMPPPRNIENLYVMVLDDEIDSLEMLKAVLEQEGAQVTTASSGAKALRMLAESQYDLLISDIGMPDMDGYTFMRNVRTLPPQHNREVPAIALTAYVGEINQRQALAAGFQTHLAKPVDPQQLLDAIATLTTDRRS